MAYNNAGANIPGPHRKRTVALSTRVPPRMLRPGHVLCVRCVHSADLMYTCSWCTCSGSGQHYVINREIEEMRDAVEYEKSVQMSWVDCFSFERKQPYRTCLVATLRCSSRLRAPTTSSTSVPDICWCYDALAVIILGGVSFGCIFDGLYVMERFGRRGPLIIGGIW
ncbi:uncharacterized protein LAESUDRAFT_85105 [Laetiporus sulphureus 93-53]|uniref:Major facilitator superfamily (MFS) profile domain-containing protein n=1 Tax=Laetiporus sulphureus 93-53 TaxID=1314785 RepID=A0A165AVC0_9APHY|nr:uncharacterized protein LAESUDRAFT_85105 [Laetiporus sulphureus 93-53]KZS99734.1 hypothetical protein LAESUDRAFT_85105 [Laetiporus sulphureus 93-53]